jgi:hypothetical protein
MADFAMVVEDGWPFADIPLVRKTPTAVSVPVALQRRFVAQTAFQLQLHASHLGSAAVA